MERTTIGVSQETMDWIQELKPFDSISNDDFLRELCRVYVDNKDGY